MNYPIEDYIINFLARKESPEDVQKLKEWLAADPAHRDELKHWLAAWDAASIMEAAKNVSTDKAYQRFMLRVGAENVSPISPASPVSSASPIFSISSFLRIAAIFVITFSLGILGYYYWTKNQPEQVAFIENIVPLGSKSEINMPDGSMVWLNAGSTLRYPANYGKTKRDIYLSGEGYFKVAQQTGKPFTVHTPLANITDLGTEFNVKAYPDEDVVETTLIKGKVVVEKGEAIGAFKRTVLKPGQKLSVIVSDSQPELVLIQLDPDIADAGVSWKERYWRIESLPLKDLAVQLERRYDVRITVDDRLKNRLFSGTFENETLEQALILLQHILSIQFHIDGKNVEINIDDTLVF